jgi:hypothetical protein
MKNRISWTEREEDGVKRETRVQVNSHNLKWQFKRADEEHWDYDSEPRESDWEMLEDILRRRAARGRSVNMFETVRRLRSRS